MRINGAGRGAQAGQCGGFDAAIRGEARTPDVPEAGLAESELTICPEAFAALALDEFLPEFERVFGFVEVRLLYKFRENIQVVNLAEHVLETLEIVTPSRVVLGEQAFDGVAEALQSNAERVPGLGLLGAQGLGVELLGAFESFQREAFGSETAEGHQTGTLAQSALQALPRFLIEFAGQPQRILSELRFAGFERGLEMTADGVAFRRDLLYPLFHNLSVAKRAKHAEELSWKLAHGWPGGIGVHLFHHGCDGTAPANSHTKIVDSVRIGRRPNVFQLLDDTVHPERKAAMLRMRAGSERRYGC